MNYDYNTTNADGQRAADCIYFEHSKSKKKTCSKDTLKEYCKTGKDVFYECKILNCESCTSFTPGIPV